MTAPLPSLSPLWLSLRSAALAVVLVAPLGLLAARQVSRWQGSRRAGADLLLLSPLVLPPTVVGFLLLQVVGRYGPLGALLARFDLEVVFAWPAVVLSAAVVSFPLMYRTLLGALDQLDPSLEAVARSLGAGPWRLLRQITLPLVRPGLLAGISLSYARALGEFGTTLMLAGNIPGRTQTLPLALFAAVDAGDRRLAWFWTVLVLGLNALCLVLVQQLLTRPWIRHAAPSRAGESVPLPRPRPTLAAQPPARESGTAGRPFSLQVDLERRHASFQLRLCFETGHRHLAILGASGAGKSLLLRCLAGLERPDRGRICLNGAVLFDSSSGLNKPLEQRRIAVVVQNNALFPHLTVAQNVGFGLAHLPVRQRQQRVAAQLEAVQLLALARQLPHQLSGGQQQRVALARALAFEPQLLLLDEPLSSQDSHLRRQLQQLMREQLAFTAVPSLLVTHDIDEAYRLADELVVIDGGRLLIQGPRRAVFDQPGSVTAARLTGCKNITPITWCSPHRVWAPAWGIELWRQRPWERGTTHVGLRANHLELRSAAEGGGRPRPNAWPCQVVSLNDGALRVSLHLHCHGAADRAADGAGHDAMEPIQVEMDAEAWLRLAGSPEDLVLSIPDTRVMPLTA